MSFLKNYKLTKHPLLVRGLMGILFIFSFILLSSCGESKGHFKIEGRFLHLNDGEFYVYSPDGVFDGLDTVKIQDGRFALEIPCHSDGLLMIVFPNFSQQPIFAESGEAVEIKADASHLKEMEVKGTDANELMTKFRKSVSTMSPPEETKFAAQFVKDHPESPVGVYLTMKYFVDVAKPDVKQASQLVALLMKSQKSSGSLARLKQQVDLLSVNRVGRSLPAFTAVAVDSTKVSNATLNAPLAVVSVWASWSFESVDGQHAISDAIKKSNGKLKALSICVDADSKLCRRVMNTNNFDWPVVCDGTSINSKLMKQLGLSTVPENIVLRNGKIIANGLNTAQLRQMLNQIVR